MVDINKEMQEFALSIKDECTKRGYAASICLADGMGHGELYHNIEELDFSMIRLINKDGKTAIHFKAYMASEPVNSNKTFNALHVLADTTGMSAMNFIKMCEEIGERIEIEREESKIIPFQGK